MLEHVGALVVELARRRVERDRDILARAVAGRLDARHEHLQGILVGGEVGCEAALVADGRAETAVVQRALQRVEDFCPHAQALREARRAAWHDHELLEVDLVVGVRAAVEHVHHRHGQHPRGLAAEVAPQRQALLRGLRMGRGERHAEDRVRAESRLVRGAVERDQRIVERLLAGRIHSMHGRGDLAVDVRHRARDALAAPRLSAVAQLGRLELARGGARGHRRVAVCARAQADLDLHRRVASAVEDLTGVHPLDLAHAARALI